MTDRPRSGGQLATGLRSPISWLIYLLLALFVVQRLAPYWREALLAFAITGLLGLLWLGHCRRCDLARSREAALAELDAMDGAEFERWITRRLTAAGHFARDLRQSGDFGVDVLAEIAGLRLGIQAKRFAGGVGNAAVQEVLAGCDYHRCAVAAVVTQSRFTPAAREQAGRAHLPVLLVDRDRVLDFEAVLAKGLASAAARIRPATSPAGLDALGEVDPFG